MSRIELLSPAGDFECLKAAVQSGADSVYFGGELFNARYSASNFDKEGLKNAIRYAKLRNVKVNFTLNTLLKDNELEDAIKLANYVYSLGCDAIIVQDLGLAKYLIRKFPEMDVHASTQMSIHSLQGVLELEHLGFKRVVLSREISLREIENICSHSNIEIECFIHGALCISYSGQCLFSSMVGGRSGNRGKCAQPCRLPYELIEKNSNSPIDKGFLLSPKDLCGLKYIPDLIKAGVKCFKIEGRMKTPEYVATVTRIYRKYIDLALSNDEYVIDDADIKELMQVFNRGGFSDGSFDSEPNTSYVFKEKPNNIGLLAGQIQNYNKSKGLITFKAQEEISINDTLCVQQEDHKYTVSELIKDKENIKSAKINDIITVGRIKGNISLGDKIYKLSDYNKNKEILDFINKENVKIPLDCLITIKKGIPISMEVTSMDNEDGSYFSMSSSKTVNLLPIDSISSPITYERIYEQITKTTDTPFEFKNVKIILDDNTYIPKISAINTLRRDCLEDLINQAIARFERKPKQNLAINYISNEKKDNKKVSYTLELNKLDLKYDYSKLNNIDRIYIPIKYFINKKYGEILDILKTKGNLYISLPIVVRDNYRNITFNFLEEFINTYNVKGIVITNLSGGEHIDRYSDLEIVANHSLNVFNLKTIEELNEVGVNCITLSPELDKKTLKYLADNSILPSELMVYGKLPIMTAGYCLLGKSNRCYPTCDMKCKENEFYLKDRLGYNFRIIPDNLQAITTIYNSKTLSIKYDEFNIDYAKISILDESIDEINNIINMVMKNEVFKGKDYTSGNLNRRI